MDPEVSLLLHCAPWKGLREEQVQVELSEKYNRNRATEVEQHIEEVWTERVTREPWLFNGAKFRLFSASLTPPPSCNAVCGAGDTYHGVCSGKQGNGMGMSDIYSQTLSPCFSEHGGECERGRGEITELRRATRQRDEGHNYIQRVGENGKKKYGNHGCIQRTKDKIYSETHRETYYTYTPNMLYPQAQKEKERDEHTHLTLQLGLTCYKDFLGTNWSAGVGALMRRGVAEFGDAHAFLAQPLGVGGVLQTMDGLVVMLRRSQKVAEAPGLLDIPGGHPEPKAVCLGVSEDSIQLEQLSESAVIRELFSSVCTEIRDEVNIPLSSLSEPVLMGIALNHTSAGRPSAEFYISCSLSSKEVKEFYWQGGPEAHESTDIVFLSQKEVMQLDMSAPLWKELCPSAKGAVMLYRIVLWDNN